MAVGSTASVTLTYKTLCIYFDTGAVENEKPVLDCTRIKCKSDSTIQQLYDAAYSLQPFTDYTIYDVVVETKEYLGPID